MINYIIVLDFMKFSIMLMTCILISVLMVGNTIKEIKNSKKRTKGFITQ